MRTLTEVRIFSPTETNREKLAHHCRTTLGMKATAAACAEDAVRGSDIVVTITTSATPVFSGEWLGEGTHINAAGSNSLLRQEIDEATVRRADPVVVDSRPTAIKEAGDLLPLLEKGRLHAGGLTELGEVIAGLRPGRTQPGQVTLFESQGMAIQDLIIAAELARLARGRGLGTEVQLAS